MQNSQLHRLDGPAVTHANGDQSWWLQGLRVTERAVEEAQIAERLERMKANAPEKATF
jgi:hypothetical protein